MTTPTQDPQRLRRRRIEAGLNQGELAEKAGISKSHMSLLERGQRNASAPVLKRLAKPLKCKVADLLPPEPSADDLQPGTDEEAEA